MNIIHFLYAIPEKINIIAGEQVINTIFIYDNLYYTNNVNGNYYAFINLKFDITTVFDIDVLFDRNPIPTLEFNDIFKYYSNVTIKENIMSFEYSVSTNGIDILKLQVFVNSLRKIYIEITNK